MSTKSVSSPVEEKTAPSTITTNTTTNTSHKSESPFVITPVADRFRSLSALRPQPEKVDVTPVTPNTADFTTSSSSSTGGVFQRTRSMGSGFAPPVLLARTASHIDYQKSDTQSLHDPYSDESSFDEGKNGAAPDPIAEKACNNFMFKLMEFQRQHKPYAPLTASTVAPTSTAAPYVAAPTVASAYTGPIVSARTSNANIQLTENNTLTRYYISANRNIELYRNVFLLTQSVTK